jgi:hypothetical protein
MTVSPAATQKAFDEMTNYDLSERDTVHDYAFSVMPCGDRPRPCHQILLPTAQSLTSSRGHLCMTHL